MAQQAKRCPCLRRCTSKSRRPRLTVQSVDNDARIQEIGCHLPRSSLTNPSFILLAQVPDPLTRPAAKLWMILVFPSSRGTFQCLNLPQAPQFFRRCLREELATSALAHEPIDFVHDRFWDRDADSPCAHGSPTSCLTSYGTSCNIGSGGTGPDFHGALRTLLFTSCVFVDSIQNAPLTRKPPL